VIVHVLNILICEGSIENKACYNGLDAHTENLPNVSDVLASGWDLFL